VVAAPAASKALEEAVAAVPRPRLVRAVGALCRSDKLLAASKAPTAPPPGAQCAVTELVAFITSSTFGVPDTVTPLI